MSTTKHTINKIIIKNKTKGYVNINFYTELVNTNNVKIPLIGTTSVNVEGAEIVLNFSDVEDMERFIETFQEHIAEVKAVLEDK